MTGIVSFYNRRHGWGFIIPDEPLNDHFVHVSLISPAEPRKFLTIGERVEFECFERNGKPAARNVRRIASDPADPTATAHTSTIGDQQ